MKRMTLLVCAALILTASCSAPTPSDPPVPDSGVRGTVLYGPLCPVIRAGTPCPDRPWQGSVQAYTQDGATAVGSAPTDKQGTFTLPLNPGIYLVTPVTPDGPPTAKFRQVRVEPGAFVEVTLQVDSGIR
jgi:hypothetical protein